MKKIITALALVLSASSYANDFNGSFKLDDGRNILRIDIGNEREFDARKLVKRITKLEMAVRDLQNRIYDLEDDATPTQREIKVFTCILPTSYAGTFIGKGRTQAEARANASNSCQQSRASNFCKDSDIKSCETSIEIEKL